MKKRQVVLYIVVMIMLLATSVYATISGKLGLKVNTSGSLYAGDQFSVTLSLSDLESQSGIKALEGYIDIDESVLEDLTIDSIVTQNGKVVVNQDNILDVYDAVDSGTNADAGVIFNNSPVSGKGDYKIVVNFAKPLTADTDVITINFKIKSDIEPGRYSGAISYKTFKIFADETEGKEEFESKSIAIVVSDKNSDDNTTNNTVTDNNTTNNTNNNTNKNEINNTTNNINNNTTNNTIKNTVNNIVNNTTNKTENNVKNDVKNNTGKGSTNNTSNNILNNKTSNKIDNTTAKTNLPKTGYRIVLIPVIIIAVLGLVFYRKYKKYDRI